MKSTGRYIKVRPNYLSHALEAVDEVLNEIRRVTTQPIMLLQDPVRAICVLDQGELFPTLALSIGAGEGIRTLDPNLGKVVLYP